MSFTISPSAASGFENGSGSFERRADDCGRGETMRDYVGKVIAGAVQRRVLQAMGPAAAALAGQPGARRRSEAWRLTALALNIQLIQLTGNGQQRRPRNGKILKRAS